MTFRYENISPTPPHGLRHILAWKLRLRRAEAGVIAGATDAAAGVVEPDAGRIHHPPVDTWQVTWIGHGSWLVQLGGRAFLVDPVFSAHCGPVPLPRLRRAQPPGLLPADLPPIDAVLLTHSHYDHLDLPSLRGLGRESLLLVPSGHAGWLRRRGFPRVREVAWGESFGEWGGCRVSATPAQHFTARTPFDRNRGHWCGWMIEVEGIRVYFAGDTGYGPFFGGIRDRFGEPDLAVLPIGAYSPRWVMRPVHVDPEEAVRVHLEVGARWSVASHWGTFRLTDEPLGEPPVWLAKAAADQGLPPGAFRALKVGETWCGSSADGTPHGS